MAVDVRLGKNRWSNRERLVIRDAISWIRSRSCGFSARLRGTAPICSDLGELVLDGREYHAGGDYCGFGSHGAGGNRRSAADGCVTGNPSWACPIWKRGMAPDDSAHFG